MRFWGNVRRSLGKILLLALSLLICVTAALEGTGTVSCKAEEAESPKWEGDRIYCVAFGDSIAKGYGGKGQEDLRCYTQLIADAVTVEARIPAQCDKFAKNGRDSLLLNTEILSTEEALAALDRADIITLTIGANDLMQEFKKAAAGSPWDRPEVLKCL